MILNYINHDYSYHIEKICLMFFPLEKLRHDGDDNVIIDTIKDNYTLTVRARVYSKYLTDSVTIDDSTDGANAMSLLLYRVLSGITGYKLPWGILYGVRPARLMHSTVEKLGVDGARKKFLDDYVSPSRVKLALDVMEHENKIIALSQSNSFSLYVSIPFCPSRCSYCSFVSHSIANAGDLIQPYVELLCKELQENGRVAHDLGLRLESIYFGGGTPTTLSAPQLDMILTTIENCFDLSTLREYTVEAGRPDTITKAKLDALMDHSVGRISINPQSFNDTVLQAIGRKHTAKDAIEKYNLARRVGFKNINMDFIAGLNSDTLDSFQSSIDTAVDLGVESVTVHNLALKSAAYLVTENEFFDLSRRNLAFDMVDYSVNKLRDSGYYSYYMYRQSKSLGALENVGWCKDGFDCLYNVFMMDETHTVLSAGAGAVTKLKDYKTGHIDRIYNYKYPYEYLNNFDEVIKRKQGIIDFYNA